MQLKIFNVRRFLALIMLISFASFTYAAPRASAIFAAGCFWCAEHDFEQVPGVLSVISGYTGGHVARPSYNKVSKGGTGHFEAIQVIYDPGKINYQQLLKIFWNNVDPTDNGGQFCDRGAQYRAAIFYSDNKQKQLAEASKKALIDSGKFKSVATLILPTQNFFPAEEYHQNYARKNPLRYRFYRYRCGRDSRLESLWSPH